ncbi:Bacteriophage abortive infection AbiH [Chishuiella changwenlii]|uniref:Bacteriophage abortive infection AbiH n=2 Tax=Chishuiella changwenlii TaxID=1434701 RepID=A0A1M6YAK8_9FLAO|nr:AbiH family protein [Chishuiella changwenlii]SHL15248.1 Bacteriophage abortive infection AbiH [Chishuiella changwenlii]
MNRIILIGNGFDKGVGLPTLYSDFTEWLIEGIIENINNKIPSDYDIIYKNIIYKVNIRDHTKDYCDDFIFCNCIDFQNINRDLFFRKTKEASSYFTNNGFKEEIIRNTDQFKHFHNSLIQFNNIFFSLLIKKYHANDNWGNIEQIFYDELIKTSDDKIEELNKDFLVLINKLEEYLKTIDIETIINSKSKNYMNYIKGNIYSDDLRSSQFCPTSIKEKLVDFRQTLLQKDYSIRRELQEKIEFKGSFMSKKFIDHIITKDIDLKLLSDEFNIDNYLFLNFNYTDTPNYFINEDKNNVYLNIHGDLTGNLNSPIIFGFGDELDENYKILEDKNNNSFLKHIKSINYLQNNSYRKLIEFLESEHFQVFIFGHSCGTSDRTLLNTIFEHDNCISIVPFIRTDRDNYQDTVMNIYRNFTDKRKLRKRVVNRDLCKNLTLNEKEI